MDLLIYAATACRRKDKEHVINTSTLKATAALTPDERASVWAIISVFVLRMLGLFMLLPVLALYASSLDGATPLLVGLAVGAYGISQAILQIPFGWASDRYGRRRLLVVGFLIFAAGSIIASLSDSITGVIVGRVVQGAGAVSAVLTALLSDVVAPQKRTRAMAFIGISIGMSFLLALMLGPLLGAYIGVSGLFVVSALFALIALFICISILPNPPVLVTSERMAFRAVLKIPELWILNFGIFALHFVLAAVFVVLPFMLREHLLIEPAHQWKLISTMLLLSLPGLVLLIRGAEKKDLSGKRLSLNYLALAIGLIFLSMLSMSLLHRILDERMTWLLVAVMTTFFSAFNFLEARLPAQVSQVASEKNRGTALGVYASSQFMGVFVGGATAGWCMGVAGQSAVFGVCAIMAVLWLVLQLATLLVRSPKK